MYRRTTWKTFLPEPDDDDDDADGVIDELFGIGASDPFEDGTPFEFESVRREEVFIGRDEAAKKVGNVEDEV